jgi:hypothetical protein
VSGHCRRRRGRDGADLLEDGQLVAHAPVLGQAVGVVDAVGGGSDGHLVAVGDHVVDLVAKLQDVDEEPQDGDGAVRPGRDQSGWSPVVDELDRAEAWLAEPMADALLGPGS